MLLNYSALRYNLKCSKKPKQAFSQQKILIFIKTCVNNFTSSCKVVCQLECGAAPTGLRAESQAPRKGGSAGE